MYEPGYEPSYEPSRYPNLRRALDSRYNDLTDEELDTLVAQIYGPVSAQDVEGLFDDIGRGLSNVGRAVGHFAQQAAPVIGRALPSIAQGALTGAKFGGPWGALAGAVAGGAGGILSQSSDPTLRGIGGAIGGVTQLASNFTGGGALGNLTNVALGGLGGGGGKGGIGGALGQVAQFAPQIAGAFGASPGVQGALGQAAQLAPQLAGVLGGRGGNSANALLGLLARPETTQALTSAAMGAFGRSNVMVGNQPVSVQSILGALGNLAGRAAGEAASAESATLPEYFYGANGELVVDAADEMSRTDALLTVMALTAPRWAWPPAVVPVAVPSAPPAEPPPERLRLPEYTAEHAYADSLLMEQEWWENGEAA
jgi:hypothetical protein